MATIKSAKPTSRNVEVECVAVDDMGVMTTKFGKKPMVKFSFESEEVDEYGNKRRYTRLFHKHTHPLSAVSVAAKSWCNRDLAAEEKNIGEVDWQSFVDSSARIKLEPGAEKDGKHYENIVEILPNERAAAATCEPAATNCEPKENK